MVDNDIAFNKPAYASSAFADNYNYYGPQYVNNGKANCAGPSGPIAHTKTEQHPYEGHSTLKHWQSFQGKVSFAIKI